MHAAAGASYDQVQQRLMELPASASRPGHLAGALQASIGPPLRCYPSNREPNLHQHCLVRQVQQGLCYVAIC